MQRFKFSTQDPVDLLDKFVREWNVLKMTEAQALFAVEEFLSSTIQSGLELEHDHNPGRETSVFT